MQAYGQIQAGRRMEVLFAQKQIFGFANGLDLNLEEGISVPPCDQIHAMVIDGWWVKLKAVHGQLHLYILLVEPAQLLLVQLAPLIALHSVSSLG